MRCDVRVFDSGAVLAAPKKDVESAHLAAMIDLTRPRLNSCVKRSPMSRLIRQYLYQDEDDLYVEPSTDAMKKCSDLVVREATARLPGQPFATASCSLSP